MTDIKKREYDPKKLDFILKVFEFTLLVEAYDAFFFFFKQKTAYESVM